MTLKDRIAKVITDRMRDHLEPGDTEHFAKLAIEECAAAVVNEFKAFIKDAE